MAEILVMAIDHVNPDPIKDRAGAYKRGMPVVVMSDNHSWGAEERLPDFVIIKIPGVSIDVVLKYVSPQYADTIDVSGVFPIYRRRQWQIRWPSLPAGAKTKLAAGGLTIKAGDYAGNYDYTWKQIKGFFRDLKTGLDETIDL